MAHGDLMLAAIQGHPGGQDPTIGDLAGHLLLKQHSAAELISRAEKAGRAVDRP